MNYLKKLVITLLLVPFQPRIFRLTKNQRLSYRLLILITILLSFTIRIVFLSEFKSMVIVEPVWKVDSFKELAESTIIPIVSKDYFNTFKKLINLNEDENLELIRQRLVTVDEVMTPQVILGVFEQKQVVLSTKYMNEFLIDLFEELPLEMASELRLYSLFMIFPINQSSNLFNSINKM